MELEAALVLEVDKDSPAEKSGLKEKDIITRLNGQPLKSFPIFRRKLMGLVPGKTIKLTVFRDGENKEIEATLIKKPAPEDS